jgi:hypothetical protein
MKLLALLLLLPVVACAQALDDGTVDVYFQQITREGELEGCSLVFTALTRDHAYRRGAQIIMNGSVAVRTLDRTDLVFTGKLGTREWKSGGPGPWEEPTHFHFATKTGSTAKHAKITKSDTTGYRLLIGPALEPEVMAIFKDMAETGEFTVGFNRAPGGQDVYSPIKINVALKRDASGNAVRSENDGTGKDFFDCMTRLATTLSNKLTR